MEEEFKFPDDMRWELNEIYWPIFTLNKKEVRVVFGTSFLIKYKRIRENIIVRLEQLLIEDKIYSYSVSEYDPQLCEDGGWKIKYEHPFYGKMESIIDLYTLLK
jgi:cellulose synthase/poly-beta-1,6-N-acetylglucosamine synthase-like glycosyltransferase